MHNIKTDKTYSEQRFTGERALFKSNALKLEYCTFADGESPLKESSNIDISNTTFQWKYPLWYCNNVVVKDSSLFEMGRAGIWYTNHLYMEDVLIEAPKTFRRCDDVDLIRIDMPNAEETLWHCSNVRMKDVSAKGNYFGMNSHDLEIENFKLIGNYPFDGSYNVHVKNARMLSKDAFWNCENIVIEDSFITGEYFAWNSKNVTLINCTLESLQGLCYIENLTMKNCRLLNTDLAFEYCSNVDAEITSSIVSVKNPYSGRIQAKEIGEIIFDDPNVDSSKTEIIETAK